MKHRATLSYLVLLSAIIAVFHMMAVRVNAFSIGSRHPGILKPPRKHTLQRTKTSSSAISSRSPYLFGETHSDAMNSTLDARNNQNSELQRARRQIVERFSWFCMKARRSVLAFCTVLLFWLGAASINTSVSHASAASKDHVISSNRVDGMIAKYVKNYMFQDDMYDPVESIYREAMNDRLTGAYPGDLKEVTSSVLGKNTVGAQKDASGSGFSGALMKTVSFLRKQGLSEMQAIALMTGAFVIGFPSIALLVVMQIGFQSKRSMNKLMKERYGETYSVDASEKKEEDVDIPDDDDEEE